jgi:tetratricopeptide (TPR) repeat protein
MLVSPYKIFILLFSQETPDEVQKPFPSVTSSLAPVSGQAHQDTIHDRTYSLGGESEPLKVTGTGNHDSNYIPGSIADKTKPSNLGIVSKFDMNMTQRKTRPTTSNFRRTVASHFHQLSRLSIWGRDPAEILYEEAMESYQKYQSSNNLPALQAALDNFESALNACRAAGADHPQLASTLIYYASALWKRYLVTGCPVDADLLQIIDFYEEALICWNKLNPRPTEYHTLLMNLATAYVEASCNDHDPMIFQKAIYIYKGIQKDETFSAQIHNLALAQMGSALCTRCRREKTNDLLDEGIKYLEEALRFASAPSTNDKELSASCLANLADACEVRFQMVGQAECLTKAIEYGYSAREFPQTGQNERILCLYDLARLLWTRYHNEGHIKDLIDAEKIAKEAKGMVGTGEMRARIASLLKDIQTQH